ALQAYFEDNRIITAYCRLNCLIDQQPLFEGYGQTVCHGVEISLDLTIPEEEQFARYRKGHRYAVRKLLQEGFFCEKVGLEYLDEFIRIYNDTMDRKHADPEYYFGRFFFEYLMNDMSDVTHLFICKDGERVCGVGMYIKCNGTVHFYLSGTEEDYIRKSPSKLLTDFVRRWAVNKGCRMFHMGAGDRTQRDSLWDFKMAFGGREHEYSTWRHVVDPGAYQDVCRRVVESAGVDPDDSYFPKYRHPLLRGDS
ncbi:MAG TPA: GNAT family N-acetyltransferase, partial [Armatimonadota bacterium]|nr:GNAT family N-acetyltransferase [Armatimonadota bacterium]